MQQHSLSVWGCHIPPQLLYFIPLFLRIKMDLLYTNTDRQRMSLLKYIVTFLAPSRSMFLSTLRNQELLQFFNINKMLLFNYFCFVFQTSYLCFLKNYKNIIIVIFLRYTFCSLCLSYNSIKSCVPATTDHTNILGILPTSKSLL